MQSRILCAVTEDMLTRPDAPHLEWNRVFMYPSPGTVIHAQAEGEVVRMIHSKATDGPLTKSFRWPGGVVDVGFGMYVIDDCLSKQEKPQVIPLDAAQFEWETVHIDGGVRAKSLARMWRDYGCVVMAGEQPTAQEIETVKALRRDFGLNRLNEVIDMQNKRRGGMKGIKPNFDRSDRAWAKEFGVALVDTVELLPRLPGAPQAPQVAVQTAEQGQRVACPECGESILPAAKRCHFCHANFKRPVSEVISEPVEQEVRT